MSKNYSAGQYEQPFIPEHMQLYGPTKPFGEHPKAKKRTTHIVANDRGHLLPGQKTVPGDCPWGNYVGTWDLPCHLLGPAVDNPTSRSEAGIQYLRKQKELITTTISTAAANKSKSVKDRIFDSMGKKMA
ncbi:unnamed protein product [Calicophoron daubneyi]|uniref:Cilia- and flagella-associated protein 126 n=1 Tax=Calicophoron daubneyi TaxID=300641 RepID=A0AAV2TLS5_CALDB